MKRTAAVLCVLALASCGGADSERLVVAAGTTIVDSGFVERLAAAYRESSEDLRISIVGAPTAEALELGARGEADLLITHQPELEARFLIDHPGATASPVFASSFVLVGPRGSGPTASTTSITETMRAIAEEEVGFVSRADGSGTFVKERELWALAGVSPDGRDWYTETGQGMGFTLQIADQRGGFTLAEEGAFRTTREALSLVPLAADAPPGLLDNPYRVIVVDPESAPAATHFAQWLTGEEGRAVILAANQELFGAIVYRVVP